jgi:hypothetical protein
MGRMTSDLRRLGGILLALSLLAACLAACEVAVGATSALWPSWLRNDWATVEFPAYQAIGSQVAGVVKGRAAEDTPIGVLLGASYQTFDVDMKALEAEVQPARKWLRLTVYAGGTCELEPMARLLLVKGRVRPATVVISLGLKMLARSDGYRRFDVTDVHDITPRAILDNLRAMRLIVLEGNLESLVRNAFNTLFPDRTKINYRLNSRLVRARMAMLERWGQGVVAAFTPSPSPWAEAVPRFSREADEPMSELIAREMEVSRREGRFDPGLYSPRHESSRSLVNLIRLVRSTGAEVVVVIVPERSIYRASIPAEARRTLSTVLQESFGAESPRVIDLESAVPDEFFGDMHHVDERGKAIVTRRLIEELKTFHAETQRAAETQRRQIRDSEFKIPEFNR